MLEDACDPGTVLETPLAHKTYSPAGQAGRGRQLYFAKQLPVTLIDSLVLGSIPRAGSIGQHSMFKWSRPKCLVDPDVKVWIEQRMNWLVGRFGWEQFAQLEVVLPIQKHFPASYDGSRDAVRKLFDHPLSARGRLCRRGPGPNCFGLLFSRRRIEQAERSLPCGSRLLARHSDLPEVGRWVRGPRRRLRTAGRIQEGAGRSR